MREKIPIQNLNTTFSRDNYIQDFILNRDGTISEEEDFSYEKYIKEMDEDEKALKEKLNYINNDEIWEEITRTLESFKKLRDVLDDIKNYEE